VEQAVRIGRRFAGPPDSGNGGYACGLAASGLSLPVEVTLQAPPPLEQDLVLVREGTESRLLHGDSPIARAREVADVPTAPPPPSYDSAEAAAAAFDVEAYAGIHAYPGCFTCGPRREPGDGLRVFPAPLRPGVVAWPWTAPASVADDGYLPEPVVWAALDCPSGLASLSEDPSRGAIVLGRMTAVVHAPVPVEVPLLVAGWHDGADGRKLHSGSAVWTRDGELLACARATWLVLTAEQRLAFGAAGG
jgi:hypothetical protein